MNRYSFDGMRGNDYARHYRRNRSAFARDDYAFRDRLIARGIAATLEQARILRRAQLTLRRWHEQECGMGNDHCSWCIVTDDDGRTFREIHPNNGKSYRYRIPDRRSGAIHRISALCAEMGIHFYVQTDPRGCALYVDSAPIADDDYTRAVACIA